MTRIRHRWGSATALAMIGLLAATVHAQPPVLSYERATELTKTYPFTRFSKLASFDVPMPREWALPGSKPQLPNQKLVLPAEVSSLNGTTIAVRGYMLPIDAKPDGVSKFILTPSIDTCHWGMLGLANEWLLIEMAGNKRVPYMRFQPVVMFGRLSIEPQWRGSALTGLYKMRGDFILTQRP
jgi:hypothetical protein